MENSIPAACSFGRQANLISRGEFGMLDIWPKCTVFAEKSMQDNEDFLRHFPQKADPAQVYSCCDRTGKREGFRIRAVNTDYDVEATESAIEIAEMRFFGYHPDIRSVTKTDEK